MNMYEVTAKCGHVGRKYYTEKIFAVCAQTAKEAAALVRAFPRVKHDHSDAILNVLKIDEERYSEIRQANDDDPYFYCKNVQEQRRNCNLDIRSEHEEEEKNDRYQYLDYSAVYYGKQRLRNPKKYMNRYVGGNTYEFETA